MIITDTLAHDLLDLLNQPEAESDGAKLLDAYKAKELAEELADQVKQNNARFILIRIDETRYWTLDLKGARAFGVYLVDISEQTHCCELTPSYTLYPLYHYTDSEDDHLQEQVSEEPMSDDVMYRHCAGIDDLIQAYPATKNDLYVVPGHDKPITGVDDLAESYDKLVEETAEIYRANWHL